jgi:catechol 2,3-dioxygenase-like lactoylglutathione lyase family enzyme
MPDPFDDLLSRFERGELPRRDFLGAILALAYGPRPQRTSAAFQARNLTHVNVRVADVTKAEQFYRDLLGVPPVRSVVGGAFGLDLPGGGFISLCPVDGPDCGVRPPGMNGEIDHFGVGIDGFEEGVTAKQLSARGLEIYDAGSSVFVKDPNGAWVQLSAPGYKG